MNARSLLLREVEIRITLSENSRLNKYRPYEFLAARKAIRGGRKRNKPANTIAMDMYNTVWLSDYESCKSEPDSLNQSIVSSLNHSRSTAMSMSESVTPFGTPGSSRPITPSRFTPIGDHNNGSLEDDRLSINSVGRKKLARTLSLPESEFATLDARDLQERFTRLQLEHENKELKKLTNDLQDALEKLEQQFLDRLHKDEDGDHRTPALSPNPRSPFFERNHDNQFSYDHNDRDSLDSRDHDYSDYDDRNFKQVKHKDPNDKFDHGCCKTQ